MAATDLDELLEGLDGDAREARRRLIADLVDDGCPEDDIRRAVAEDRLPLLPVDRVLARETPYSLRDMADEVGIDLTSLRRARAAFGLTLGGDDEPRFGEADLEVTRSLKTVLDSGISLDGVVEFNRVVGRAMLQVAAASRGMFAEAVFKPGTDEHNIGVAAAAAARELVPRMSPTLAFVYEAHLRELLRSDVINAADIAAGRTPGAREMAEGEGDEYPSIRSGVAIGPALERAGDWYGSPVNVASRITGVARPASVLAPAEVRDATEDDFDWRSAGRKRLKGVKGPIPLHRARPT